MESLKRLTRLTLPAAVLLAGAALGPLAAAPRDEPVADRATGAGYTYFWTAEDGSRYRLRTQGEIEYTPDGSDVRDLAADGSLLVEQTAGSSIRRLEVRRGAGGTLDRLWTVDGLHRPYDREAGRWLAEALASFERPRKGQREEELARAEAEAARSRPRSR